MMIRPTQKINVLGTASARWVKPTKASSLKAYETCTWSGRSFSARRGELGINERFTVESIIGSTFTGRILETTKFGDYDAVIPEVEGKAHITGRNEWFLDPTDSLRDGFILR